MMRKAWGRAPHRRRFLQGAGGLLVASTLPAQAASADSDVTGRLARYMVEARDKPLPPEVLLACKHRILDTFGAMISGARMRPGEMATSYVRRLGGVAQSSVVASDLRTTAINAALANAMCAHADETDDFEPVTKAHPGSATVPAAFAMAEKEGRSGAEMIRAVALGYDLCCRLLLALGPDLVRGTHRSAEGTSSTFGALGAAAALARLDERGMRFALSYAAQQVSGLWSWVKDEDHIEKAFDFAGMGARNGVTAVAMVQAGLTGVFDVLDGTHNLFIALSTDPKPEAMLESLGSRFYVTETAIKTFSVGYPIQSPLDAVLALRERLGVRAEDVRRVVVRLPTDAVGIVGQSAMPDVNCQHLVALALVKGAVSFADSHDAGLMQDAAIQSLRAKVEIVGDPALMTREAPRSARVELTLADGRMFDHFTKFPPGTKENPLSTERVNAKARDLIEPVLGASRADTLIVRLNDLENLDDIRMLRPLITA
ncbi:MmgE/PrpD family protein [Methylobacterium sp. J-048]|uniref:MmgE/PrpD family protein n=1 Tax=Methylobacterium sp. J-048 TaxID=2836635 RepID=UPI001FBB6494|nr:MmgE/PrpD family protein [Methylobacterium sp. J-048]MCJ2057208.1 MmgE/PrpD family protein [Methylobacterium sp. J-048]